MLIEEPHGGGVDLFGVSNLPKSNGHLSAGEPITLY
jgi:hypothetical protein